MKILRREGTDLRQGLRGSGLGGSAENDGDSGSDEGKSKMPTTREEREARYEAARLRIMGSAKPSEDVSAPEKKDDSRSSSTTGKKKQRKQRSDSEDGFEARSAYSTYPNSGTPNLGIVNGQIYAPLQHAANMPYDQNAPWASQHQYGGEYPTTMSSQAGPYPWYQQGYPGMTDSGQQAPWFAQNTGSYDLSGHFQQSMTFQQPNMHFQQPSQSVNNTYGGGSSAHSSPRQWPSQMHAPTHATSPHQNVSSPHQAPGPSPHQPYAYGLLPNQAYVHGKRQNPNHPIPGSFNRQQFNPQSQTFTPSQASPPSMAYQPIPHTLQRQYSSQSQGSSYGPSYTANQLSNLPSAHGLTHPLPQPVFPQSSQSSNRQSYQQYGPPSRVDSTGPQSGISKYGGASLPAKPPPPMSGAFSANVNQVSQGQSHSNSPIHVLPSMVNFRPGNSNDGSRNMVPDSRVNGRVPIQNGTMRGG